MDKRRMEGDGERAGIYAMRKRRGAAPRRVARLGGGGPNPAWQTPESK